MALTLATITPGVAEIFAAPQGEGPSAGEPCAFVRLSRCNLACHWCDTAYSWRFEGDARTHKDGVHFPRADNQMRMSEDDVVARIVELGLRRLVITGGEPLLQAPALAKLLRLLPPMVVEVETNGTIAPPAGLAALVQQWNVSPKLAHSGNARDLAIRARALSAFAADPRAIFKFVVAQPADVDEVRTIADAHTLPAARIWLMPEGRDSAALRARMQWLGEMCSENEFSLSDRLHIHAHGDTRGT